MTFELGQIVENKRKYWVFENNKMSVKEVIEDWVVIDILYDGDIVLGEYKGKLKVLYQRDPYVIGCNNPIPLKYHIKY